MFLLYILERWHSVFFWCLTGVGAYGILTRKRQHKQSATCDKPLPALKELRYQGMLIFELKFSGFRGIVLDVSWCCFLHFCVPIWLCIVIGSFVLLMCFLRAYFFDAIWDHFWEHAPSSFHKNSWTALYVPRAQGCTFSMSAALVEKCCIFKEKRFATNAWFAYAATLAQLPLRFLFVCPHFSKEQPQFLLGSNSQRCRGRNTCVCFLHKRLHVL